MNEEEDINKNENENFFNKLEINQFQMLTGIKPLQL